MFLQIARLYIDSYSGLPRKVWYLSLVLLINRSGAMILPFLTVYLTDRLGYPPTQAAWAMFSLGIGGVVGNYIGGRLNDRYGSWHIQWISVVLSGLLFISMAWVGSLLGLCIMIFLATVAADCFRPANRAAVAFYTPPAQLTQAFGLQRMAVNLGLAMGPVFAALLLEYAGYRWLFWGDGLTCLLAAVAFIVLIPADRTARPLADEDSHARKVDTRSGQLQSGVPGLRSSWLLTFCASNTLLMLTFFLFVGVLPVEMVERGYREMDYSRLLLYNGLLIVAFEMVFLHLIKGRYALLRIMRVGALLVVAGNACLWLSGLQLPMLYVYITLLTFGEIFYMPFTHTYVTARAPLARRGEYLGLMSASYATAFSLVAPISFWLEAQVGWDRMVLLSCLTGIVALIGLESLARKERHAPIGLAES